jgi:hypothetical protein
MQWKLYKIIMPTPFGFLTLLAHLLMNGICWLARFVHK